MQIKDIYWLSAILPILVYELKLLNSVITCGAILLSFLEITIKTIIGPARFHLNIYLFDRYAGIPSWIIHCSPVAVPANRKPDAPINNLAPAHLHPGAGAGLYWL